MSGRLSVLQVPEVCDWNPYVAAGADALAAQGVDVLAPGWCLDLRMPHAATYLRGVHRCVRPSIVHLHWPEKLAHQVGVRAAVQVLEDLVDGGAFVVQTIHNIAAHESSRSLEEFQRFVDGLSHGIHVFSPGHEALARDVRPCLPPAVLHMPHPKFPTELDRLPAPRPDSIGCFGRLRGYKRTAGFARAFLDGTGPHMRMVVAGEPDSGDIDRELTTLAAEDGRLVYRPGFVDGPTFWRALASVEWVALPYSRIYSSGVLVAALQMGRRILSPTPAGGCHLYGQIPENDRWVVVDPWDDDRAIAAWRAAAETRTLSLPPVTSPTWEEAAARLIAFYSRLLAAKATSTPPHQLASKGEDPHG